MRFEHGDKPNQWLAFVEEVEGCHTSGRGLDQTRGRIREALELWEGKLPKDVEIQEVYPLPKTASAHLQSLRELRAQLRSLRAEQETRLAGVISELTERGWSVRDTASLIGVSHQHINKVSRTPPKRRRAAKKASARR